MIWFSLMSSASADPNALAICALAELVDTSPTAGAVDVPTDAVPALVFQGECGLWLPITVELRAAGQVVDVRTIESVSGGEGGLWVVDVPFDALQPSTEYEMVVRDLQDTHAPVPFTTGAAPTVPVTGRPGLELHRAERDDQRYGGERITIDATLAPVSGPGAVIVLRHEGREVAAAIAADGDPFQATLSWAAQGSASEVCVTAIERDARGDWHGPSDPRCVRARRGCDHGGGAPWLALAGLPLLLRRRR